MNNSLDGYHSSMTTAHSINIPLELVVNTNVTRLICTLPNNRARQTRGEGCLCHSSHWVCEEIQCCACLPILLDHLHEQQHAAIVIVVTPLTAIMEEQVRPSITIAKVKNSIIIQVASFSITTKQATRDAEKSMKEYEANTDTCRRDYYFIQQHRQ